MAIPLSQWAREYLGAHDAAFLETPEECCCIQRVGEDDFVCWQIKRDTDNSVTAKMTARNIDAVTAVRIGFEAASAWSRKGGVQ